MTIFNLYRYERADGGITVSPVEPPEGTEYIIKYRLIADEGMLLQKDDITTPCVDTDEVEGWIEIEDPDYVPPVEE